MRFAPPPIQTTINFFPHSPSVAFPLAKIPAPWLFLCGFFLCALYHHLRQFFLCALHYHLRKRGVAFSCALCAAICGSFFYAVCASIFASAVWRLFLCCLHCRFQQFFLCALRYHLRTRGVTPVLMRFALPFTQARCAAFSYAVCSVRYCPLKGCLPAALPPAPLRPAGQTRRALSRKSAPPGHPRPAV